MVSTWAVLVCLGSVCGGEGVSVLPQTTTKTTITTTTTPTAPPHPTTTTTTNNNNNNNSNTSSPIVVVLSTKGPSPPAPPPSSPVSSSSSPTNNISPTSRHIILVSEAGVTEGVSPAKDIETEYEEEDREYEMLPQPLAQDGSNEGYVRGDGTYIVNDVDGIGCVMAYFKSTVTIYYLDNTGEYRNTQASPPDGDEGVVISGQCDRQGEQSQLDVTWESYTLTLKFGLDSITDSWFVSRFLLNYNTDNNRDFDNIAPSASGEVTVGSTTDRKYWQTSNYKSFRCLLLHDVALSDALNNTATLHFDEVRVQAFCTESIFRRPKHCIHRVHRDEMVPVTVGGMLAGGTLLTVFVYGIFRYVKIKKVQYDTMQ
ncbi:hypothetical protein Pmani_011874 [Petrolisthes manimaculis]|uniref:Lysosome-associated membrane glycoprotein 5 n=1 Tax=Petrolisthes manimaculis TaxID=1843537 RepID=A0AAE1UAT0_9EUCA|nr:hypothetical protein Pmani_011874 [Petrolisthes manimaculis]